MHMYINICVCVLDLRYLNPYQVEIGLISETQNRRNVHI